MIIDHLIIKSWAAATTETFFIHILRPHSPDYIINDRSLEALASTIRLKTNAIAAWCVLRVGRCFLKRGFGLFFFFFCRFNLLIFLVPDFKEMSRPTGLIHTGLCQVTTL